MEETTRLCNDRNNLVGVTLHTNLRADWEGVIGPFIDELKSERLVVNGSLHDSSIPHAEVDRFFEKVKKLRSRGVTVLVTYLVHPDDLYVATTYKQRCDDLRVHFGALPYVTEWLNRNDPLAISPVDTRPRFSRAQLIQAKLLCSSADVYALYFEQRTTLGMACGAGSDYIYISPDGSIHPCLTLAGDSPIGHILEGLPELPSHEITCPRLFCLCPHEATALRIVDRYYRRGRFMALLEPKPGVSDLLTSQGYQAPLYFLNAVAAQRRKGNDRSENPGESL